MAFTLVKDPNDTQTLLLPISSNAVALGDMIELDVGAVAWTDADSATEHWQKKAVAIETVTSSATYVKAIPVMPGQMWEATSTNNSAVADNGDRMVLSSTSAVNNTGTDSTAEEAVFLQYNAIGTNTDKKILGEIVFGSGIDPDAS